VQAVLFSHEPRRHCIRPTNAGALSGCGIFRRFFNVGGLPNDGGSGDDDDFHGQRRSENAHEPTTDPDAQLMRKGKQAKLSGRLPLATSSGSAASRRGGILADLKISRKRLEHS